jgi:hypothetical protein
VYAKADSNRREHPPAQASKVALAGNPRGLSRSVCAWPAARQAYPPHRHHAQGSMSKFYATLEKLAAMDHLGPMLSNNFLVVPQLDIDWGAEFLCIVYR